MWYKLSPLSPLTTPSANSAWFINALVWADFYLSRREEDKSVVDMWMLKEWGKWFLDKLADLAKDPPLATGWTISDPSASSFPLLDIKDFNEPLSRGYSGKIEGWVSSFWWVSVKMYWYRIHVKQFTWILIYIPQNLYGVGVISILEMKNEKIQDYRGKLSLVMQSVGVRAWMWIICLSTLLHYLLKRAGWWLRKGWSWEIMPPIQVSRKRNCYHRVL